MPLNKLSFARKTRHWFLFTSLSILTLLFFGYLTPRKWGDRSIEGCDFQICVHDTGTHTNVIVPVSNPIFDWSNYLSLHEIGIDNTPSYNYLSFGWGDRDFYMQTPTWADLDISITFRALFLPTPSVISVQGYKVIPQNIEIKCIKVNQTSYLQLMVFIENTFQLDVKGRKIRVGDGHHFNAGFYAAKGSYSILRNCNSWVAEGLRKADINTPLWDGLSSAVMLHLRGSC